MNRCEEKSCRIEIPAGWRTCPVCKWIEHCNLLFGFIAAIQRGRP
jgi:hypothetical protein